MAAITSADLLTSGVTAKTPGNIQFGAGTIHRGLKYDGVGTKKWNFKESLVGATNGGSKLEITPNVEHVEVDGALVNTMGLTVKNGEKALMEVNLAELTPDVIKASVIGKSGVSEAEGLSMITSKPNIEAGDYWENIAFVGKTLAGTPIIAILENALCTSGLSLEGKNKEAGVQKCTFECNQKIDGDLSVLPYKIYYPTPAV